MTTPLEQTHSHAEVIQALSHLAAAAQLLDAASREPSVSASADEIAILREARSARLSTLDTLRTLTALCHQPSVPAELREIIAARKPISSLQDLIKPAPESDLTRFLSSDSR